RVLSEATRATLLVVVVATVVLPMCPAAAARGQSCVARRAACSRRLSVFYSKVASTQPAFVGAACDRMTGGRLLHTLLCVAPFGHGETYLLRHAAFRETRCPKKLCAATALSPPPPIGSAGPARHAATVGSRSRCTATGSTAVSPALLAPGIAARSMSEGPKIPAATSSAAGSGAPAPCRNGCGPTRPA